MNLIGQFFLVGSLGTLFRSEVRCKFWKFLSAQGLIVECLFGLGLSSIIFLLWGH